MVKITDVATEAGVSVATVSRRSHNTVPVNPALAARVQAAWSSWATERADPQPAQAVSPRRGH